VPLITGATGDQPTALAATVSPASAQEKRPRIVMLIAREASDAGSENSAMAVNGAMWRLGPLAVVMAAYTSPTAAAAEGASAGAESDSSIHGAVNNGEDFTHPVGRFDLRGRYERLPDDNGLEPEKWVTTLRTDLWAGLGQGWKLYGRVDLPFVYANDVTGSSNPNGHAKLGVGDLLTEVAIILPPPAPRLGYGFGVRAVWPTAGLDEAGKGKYQIGPLVGVRYSLPEISPGSFFLTEVRYQNSIASRSSARSAINQLNIQPKLNVSLPSAWSLTFFASENIEINFADGDKVFVPFDLMVGRKFGENLIASVEYSRELFHDRGFEPYEWQLEGRIGYHF
jgi:hypothetical protein